MKHFLRTILVLSLLIIIFTIISQYFLILHYFFIISFFMFIILCQFHLLLVSITKVFLVIEAMIQLFSFIIISFIKDDALIHEIIRFQA